MTLQASLIKKTFHFDFDARTSRGAMKDKNSWFIKIWDDKNPDVFGIGEYGPLPGLSMDYVLEPEEALNVVVDKIKGQPVPQLGTDLLELQKQFIRLYGIEFIKQNPATVFALETAFLDLSQGGARILFKNEFIRKKAMPINGLIWMGGLDFMLQQIEIKIRDGFRCVKLKVGGIDFEKECDVLQYIRRKYYRENITVRLDANGAFKPDDVLYKLKELSKFDVHSIEQPVKQKSPLIAELCRTSPIPVALDEELIGVADKDQKEKLLKEIKPRFIILKPSLHGGLYGCKEWIELAESQSIGWWLTSALESNIGLNAISQFAANYDIKLPQGLGTGQIYRDNFPSPLIVKKGELLHEPRFEWDLSIIN
jgi:O-succinylbenzoate synthase